MIGRESGTLGGSALASWTPLWVLVAVYGIAVLGLWSLGSPGPRGSRADAVPTAALRRIGRGASRLTGLPGWAGVAIGQALWSLLVAGVGFYNDVAWHIALGRDTDLFTAPHTAILVGLVGILAAAVFGVVVATLDGATAGRRWSRLVVPWSLVPLGALGLGAVSGFPADEVWHEAFGVDVTMWSPTHMLMILGASFVGLATLLILAETGARATDSRRMTALYGVSAWLTVQGLVAPQGEYSFGVPQFNHLFHPLLISAAAGLGLVVVRIALGRGWALGIAVATLALQVVDVGGSSGPADTRFGGTFVVSALGVELLTARLGTGRPVRLAVASGIWIGTVGLAAEWLWNQGAFQRWDTSMLPEAVVLSTVVAVGAAIVGVGVAGAFRPADTRAPGRMPPLVAVAGIALVAGPVVALLDRDVGEVAYVMDVEPVAADPADGDAAPTDGARAVVTVTLDPPDAADDASWFQVTAWQGGGLVLADMVEITDGVWRTERPVPVSGHWKTLVRLHRGTEMMAAPVWFPEDPEIGEPEIPAIDRSGHFEPETDYLLRETFDGTATWLSPLVHGYLVVVCLAWLGAFAVAVRGIARARRSRDRPPAPVSLRA